MPKKHVGDDLNTAAPRRRREGASSSLRAPRPGLLAAALLALTQACAGGGEVARPQGASCTRGACDSGVSYSTTLPAGAADPSGLEVTVCRNTVCATTALLQKDAARWAATLIGPLSGQIELVGAAEPRLLHITLTGLTAAAGDIDTYVIRVQRPGQAPLIETSQKTSYQIVRPDGGDCDGGCPTATLS